MEKKKYEFYLVNLVVLISEGCRTSTASIFYRKNAAM